MEVFLGPGSQPGAGLWPKAAAVLGGWGSAPKPALARAAATNTAAWPTLSWAFQGGSITSVFERGGFMKLGVAMLASSLVLRRSVSKFRCRHSRKTVRLAVNEEFRFRQILKLAHLGSSPGEKALSVNLDPKFYGSFAEIGAGQEVSRTFLKAGAAAGTVARSISAYDMKMSDVSYGKAKRYVTNERLQQMLTGEYEQLEQYLRESRGDDTRFFAFASTLAAKAFQSDRECEGWVGLTYQAEVGAPRSTVSLHVRMSDPTAQLQGEAIGVLGTNLIYSCHRVSDPYIITSMLLDGLELNQGVEKGRLEIDFIEFSGPAFPDVEYRRLALRMVQLRLANAVLLEPGKDGSYRQAVPNEVFYKRPVIVERSRFTPVTNMHRELMEASARKLIAEEGAGMKPPLQVLDLQVDDITQPVSLVETKARIKHFKEMAQVDLNGDGMMSLEELEKLVGNRLSKEETQKLFNDLDTQNKGFVPIDCVFNISGGEDSFLLTEFLDRFEMLAPLQYSVLVSNIATTHELATYMLRYTNSPIVVAVGGGNFSIERALFSQSAYAGSQGGMLEALGRLFAKGSVKVFTYPNIDADGKVTAGNIPHGDEALLYEYLVSKGAIVRLTEEYMSPSARDPATNRSFRFGSQDVKALILKGDASWEVYVPDVVREVMKTRKWFSRLEKGTIFSTAVYKVLNEM